MRELEKWRGTQKSFGRYTGSQDLSLGQYAIYRVRFTPAGDLTDSWGDFGGLTAQLDHLANVLELSITDHAGIAVAYDRRAHLMMQKEARKRSTNEYSQRGCGSGGRSRLRSSDRNFEEGKGESEGRSG